ncbi:MAG: hypothetical protein Q9207_003377 [Kuettlingeria erythrocarpa]
MSLFLNTVKLVLLSLSGIGTYLTWYLFMNNGAADMMNNIRDPGPHIVLPYTNGALLKEHYTGIGAVDYQLRVMAIFFYNLVDGSHPSACLQAYHFGGQLVAGYALLTLESLRSSNRWRIISFVTVWGFVMQNAAFAVVMPLYCAIHLATSPTVWSRKQSDFFVDPLRLKCIPYSMAFGFVLPAALMALPAPSIVSYERKQVFMAIWQAFPIWVGILEELIALLWGSLSGDTVVERTRNRTIDSMRNVYGILLCFALVTRVSAWTISVSSVLFPGIFAPTVVDLLSPSSVFRPLAATPSVKMPSIAAGGLQFLQYDEMVGSAACVLWSAALYLSVAKRKSVDGWVSMVVKGVVLEALAGPEGFAVAALWARDETIFAVEQGADRKDL